jgi:hypothetical protein
VEELTIISLVVAALATVLNLVSVIRAKADASHEPTN